MIQKVKTPTKPMTEAEIRDFAERYRAEKVAGGKARWAGYTDEEISKHMTKLSVKGVAKRKL